MKKRYVTILIFVAIVAFFVMMLDNEFLVKIIIPSLHIVQVYVSDFGTYMAPLVSTLIDIPNNISFSLQGEPSEIPQSIAMANNDFAMDFYGQVSGNDDDNIFFSPLSMYVAFSMLYEGARENTAQQIQQVFGFDSDVALRHNATAHIMPSLNRDDPHATLELANSVWIADWFSPYDSYMDIIRKTYLAKAERVNFLGDGVGKINAWASEKTHGKIKKVLAPDAVSYLTAMVLANAIYFKGTWVTQFPAEDTRESDFWTNSNSIRTDFMNVRGTFNYAEGDGVQVLKMPYKGDRLSMLVVLPSERDGIKRLQEMLSTKLLQKWQQGMTESEVIVSIPKFEMKTHYDLEPSLTSLGMTDAFKKKIADLSGIADVSGRNLFVSKAVQDAYVNVNEEGTEAAAVTTIVIGMESMPPPPPKFTADHPFIFIIQDDESGTILFMGRVSDPSLTD